MDVEIAIIIALICSSFVPVFLYVGVLKLLRSQPSLIYFFASLAFAVMGVRTSDLALQHLVGNNPAEGYLTGVRISTQIQFLIASGGLVLLGFKQVFSKKTG